MKILWNTRLTEQSGHWNFLLQFLQITKGANPLLFKKNKIWFPLTKFFLTFSIVSLAIQLPLFGTFSFKLIISKLGSEAFLYLWDKKVKLYLFVKMLLYVSTDGIAVTKLMGIFSKEARVIAISLAL